jgi:prophage regulatory protein
MPKTVQKNQLHQEPEPTRNSYQRTTLPETGFVRLPAVLHVTGMGKSCWWAGVKSGKFPAPIKAGPRMTVWDVDDIRAYIARVKAQRTA